MASDGAVPGLEPVAPPPGLVDVLDHPDAVAAELAAVRPGPGDAVVLSLLDPAQLSAAARVDALVALERQLGRLQAQQQRMLAALDGTVVGWEGRQLVDYTQEQVGAALRLSPGTAADRLVVARALVDRLPATLAMLDRGQITYMQAKKLAEAVIQFDDKTTKQVEQRVLARAAEQTLSQFTASVRRAVIAADPHGAEQRHEDAVQQRRVVFTPQPDGMTEMWALLTAEGAALISTVLDSLASSKDTAETRTADQRRADALIDAFARVLGDPHLPEQHGMRPAIQITMALSTLLGCDQTPAELAGYGPITAGTARRLAADPTGTWRRLLTDPATGRLLDYGRSTYRPPADLAEYVIARDQTCTFPGCRCPARRCDIDHQVPWENGGTTCEHNLAPLCRRHHRAKHDAGWAVQRHPDGSYHWASPIGHRHVVRPPAYPPDT